jgi:hypothetical protein
MATEKQIAANRANASRSTGPRTPSGKARASQNALRHRSLGNSTLLCSESARNFNAFVAGFYAEHQPSTPTEFALVDTMAAARWRILRMSNIDAANLSVEFNRQQNDPAFENLDNATRTGLAYREMARESRTLDLINRSEARLQRQFDSALDRLLRLQSLRGKSVYDPDSIVQPPPSSANEPNLEIGQ